MLFYVLLKQNERLVTLETPEVHIKTTFMIFKCLKKCILNHFKLFNIHLKGNKIVVKINKTQTTSPKECTNAFLFFVTRLRKRSVFRDKSGLSKIMALKQQLRNNQPC